MSSIPYLLTLFILAACFTLLPQSDDSKAQCVTITRAEIEKLVNRPAKCFKEAENVECFEAKHSGVNVLFNESGVAKRIEIATACSGIRGLKEDFDQFVPEKARGKYRQRREISEQFACERVYEEEYECVKITYLQQNCRGCVPASITVEWK